MGEGRGILISHRGPGEITADFLRPLPPPTLATSALQVRPIKDGKARSPATTWLVIHGDRRDSQMLAVGLLCPSV